MEFKRHYFGDWQKNCIKYLKWQNIDVSNGKIYIRNIHEMSPQSKTNCDECNLIENKPGLKLFFKIVVRTGIQTRLFNDCKIIK